MSRPITTGTVPPAQHQLAKSFRPRTHASSPSKRPPEALKSNERRNNLSLTAIDIDKESSRKVSALIEARGDMQPLTVLRFDLHQADSL